MNRVILRPCNRGRNARGICAHKRTKKAKRPKRQTLPHEPVPVTSYRMRLDRV